MDALYEGQDYARQVEKKFSELSGKTPWEPDVRSDLQLATNGCGVCGVVTGVEGGELRTGPDDLHEGVEDLVRRRAVDVVGVDGDGGQKSAGGEAHLQGDLGHGSAQPHGGAGDGALGGPGRTPGRSSREIPGATRGTPEGRAHYAGVRCL
ncbi:unnamed protein product [Phytophthora lilii]|uniref:Unnamed protein product n=1 Tax=Phytophthora lilii TaxID=2077276 RepID=A0A9W6XEQ5_9STRA|nr:unnamed protein product [Phytophthora lilii]